MKTITKKLYEVMFLVDPEQASDWAGINKTIKNILKRSEAEIVSIRKWDERKLAYEINGKSRGTYILCYVRSDGEKIRDIEREVRLSEKIMRVLILNFEAISEEDIERNIVSPKDTSSEKDDNQMQKADPQSSQVYEEGQLEVQETVDLAEQQDQQEGKSDN